MIEGKQQIEQRISKLAQEKVPFLFVINFEGDLAFIEPIEQCAEQGVLFKAKQFKNYETPTHSKKAFTFSKHPMPAEQYKQGFDKVQEAIAAGNTYLINLTYPTQIDTSLSMQDIFYRSKAKYKLLFKDQFVVFSPETFVHIQDQKIYSYPMKGTIDATIPDAYEKLKTSHKEIAEHHTIVDLIRNDLNQVSKRVGLEKFRTIEKIITHDAELYTVSSRIAGQLPENYQKNLGEILSKMLPAGSVTGAPKKKTVSVIKEAEQYDRGFYTGIFGIFDGSTMQSAVMIRFIEKINGKLFFKSGGGITTFSDCAAEYQELIDKVYLPITTG